MSLRLGLRLLALDGGGARSFSQLVIMKQVMEQLRAKKYPNETEKEMRPSEHFDMIGGSGTGGLLAIMFARLQMTVDEVMTEFETIVKKVYTPQFDTPSERTRCLRDTIEKMLISKGWDPDTKLETNRQPGEDGSQQNHCAGFALVLSFVELRQKVCLRSYGSRRGLSSGISVMDAMWATCASDPIFAPVTVGSDVEERTYVGADLGASNPAGELVSEACALFGAYSNVAILLSLGSGHPGIISMPIAKDETIKSDLYRQILSDGETLAEELQRRMGGVDGLYFRLSVSQGMQRNESTSDNEMDWVSAQASSYMKETSTVVSRCIQTLSDGSGWISLEKLEHCSAPRPVYRPIPMRAQHYLHRDDAFSKLVDSMFIEQTVMVDGQTVVVNKQRVVVVAGMPGCGKTQLVTEALRRYGPLREGRFQYAFFVDASSERSITSDLIAHIQLIIARDGSRIDLADALNFFQDPSNRKWLIVYDNVDDSNINLRPFLPKCDHGVIIITTRNALLSKLASKRGYLGLGVMEEPEAVDLILQCAGRDLNDLLPEERTAAASIAGKLGCLPLALTQAGCHMSDNSCSCSEYLELLQDHLEQLMIQPSGDHLNDCAYATFDLMYKNRLTPHLREVIHLLSFYHFASFPTSVISHAAKKSFLGDKYTFAEGIQEAESAIQLLRGIFLPSGRWSPLTLPEITSSLRKYSLVSMTEISTNKFIHIHPLIREWAFHRLEPNLRARFRDAACRLLVVTDEPDIVVYLPSHIESVRSRLVTPEVSLNDRAAFGAIMRAAYQRKVAQGIWLSIYDTLHDKDPRHPNVAIAALEYAFLDDDPGLKQMEKFETEAVSILKAGEGLGPEPIKTLEAMGQLSATFSRQGRHIEAVTLQKEVVDEMKRRLPQDDPRLLEEERRSARNFTRQGKYSKAKDIRRLLLDKAVVMFGHNHLETLDAMYNLALTHDSQRQYRKAEALLVKVLEGRRKMGASHLEILNSIHALSMNYTSQLRPAKAEQIQAELSKEWMSLDGELAVITPAIMGRAAADYSACGRHIEAVALQQKILDGHKTRLGDEHELTITAMNTLGLIYYAMGSYSEALALWKKVSEAWERQVLSDPSGDSRSLDVARCMHQLSWAYYKLGKRGEARKACLKAERVRKSLLGIQHPDYRSTTELVQCLGIDLSQTSM